jgi:3-dehydro-L-gulonate 2-dehydrogenase
MRAGSYGWQAANAGCAAMLWTNTMPNLPPWGATTPALGNNPLVVAVPRASGAHIVLDIAMSQFSYGSLAAYAARGEKLPVPGGFDTRGELSTDPAAIEQTQRALPIGFWKGSGLAFVLDVLAAGLSAGKATSQITPDPLRETGLSQMFLAISPQAAAGFAQMEHAAQAAIDALHAASPVQKGNPARYPGESTLRIRERNLREGVPVDDGVWQAFLALEAETR